MAKSKHHPAQPSFPGIEPDLQQKLAFAKRESGANGKQKAMDAENGPPNLAKAVKVRVPDFSQPKRPKTCLEVDFPIVPINELSALEGNAGKPIYQMSKWWARRRSSVFRAMLIAAAMEAPARKNPDGSPELDDEGIPIPDETEVSKAVWDVYYANHQKAENFKHLKVLDCFMGGGTTLVEGSRLGFQVTGVDLNPVAWFVVKNELACTDPDEVRKLFDQIEAEVKPVIQPFYVADCPRGHQGRWYKLAGTDDPADDTLMPADFDPLTLAPDERKAYRYVGPEVIYTFWAKHGQCTKRGCDHRTPVFRTPVIAEKKLGVKYIALTCKNKDCRTEFHAELGAARMAPGAERVILNNEQPFTELSQPFAQRLNEYGEGKKEDKQRRVEELLELIDQEQGLCCPKCGEFSGQFLRDVLQMHKRAERVSSIDKKHLKIEPRRNGKKPVYSYLLVDPQWLRGSTAVASGAELGGHPDASVEATSLWYDERLKHLRLIEVRGRIKLSEDPTALGADEPVPEDLGEEEEAGEGDAASAEDETDRKLYGLPRFITLADGRGVDTRKGTIPQKSHFTCGKCGKHQDLREAMEASKHAAPVAVYTVQCYCPDCEAEGRIYGGRYFSPFAAADSKRLVAAEREWHNRREADLRDYWPREEIPYSYMTHHANFALPRQGYTHWWKMFNSRQLVVHAEMARFLRSRLGDRSAFDVAMQALGAHQQYLRNQCMFAFWHSAKDHFAPHFGNPNYSPKNNVVEVGLWTRGYGSWSSTISSVIEGTQWAKAPWDPLIVENGSTKSEKVAVGDPVMPGAQLFCHSASELPELSDQSVDLVITDPPFGDNIFYSDLANFFHAWLRLPLRHEYPDLFDSEKTPNAQEALAPRLLSEEEANDYYRVRLTACWAEACRKLKDGGLMAFTFHHSEDTQWAVVLESLFDAGFLLEQTFPIASDEQKGEGGQFGAKGTEYDVIHVCRKRLEEPTSVSWPKMRQWVKGELTRLRRLLAAYKAAELSDADVRVILRGKALEFYSRHYGQIFTVGGDGERETMSIRHALAGINQLLDEDTGTDGNRPPSLVQPLVYQYLRLFGNCPAMKPDDLRKNLFGTAIRQKDLEDRGWIHEENRRVEAIPIRERFEDCRRRPRKEMKTELDQAHFLIGGAMPGSEVNLEQELTKDTWMVRPTVAAVLDWYAKSTAEAKVRDAAALAADILRRAKDKLREQPQVIDRQRRLFEDWEDEEW